MKNSKTILLFTLILLTLVITMNAFAGYRWNIKTTISQYNGNQYATGVLRSIAESSNTSEYLYCRIRAIAEGNNEIVQCEARDANDNYLSCLSHNSALIRAASAITPYSYVTFFVDANGQCTELSVYNGSAGL